MTIAYNMSGFEAATNVLDQYKAIDAITNNVLSTLLLVSLFIILLISLIRQNEAAESFFSAGIVCMVISSIFWLAGITNVIFVLGFAVIAGLAAVGIYSRGT